MPTPDPLLFDFDAVFDVDDYLYFYEDTLQAEDAPAQVDFLEQALAMHPPMRVLDLGCGHGRHAIELARRGYPVTAIDRMPGFLARARADAAAAGVTVDFRPGDLRELDLVAEADVALCLFDVFGFHGDEDNLRVLSHVARALVPGGHLCLEVRNRDWMVRNLQPTTVLQRDGDLMIDRHAFDSLTGRVVDRRVLVRGGRVREAPFSVRLYTFSELQLLLGLVGLATRAAFGSWQGAPPSVNLNRLVVVAEKVG